jgi:hypothetical protein
MGQKCDYNDYDVFGCSQSVEHRTFALGKRLVAYMALVSSVFATIHTNIAFTNLPTCRTGRIRAKYALWVHCFTLMVGFVTEPDCASGPRFVKLHLLHG